MPAVTAQAPGISSRTTPRQSARGATKKSKPAAKNSKKEKAAAKPKKLVHPSLPAELVAALEIPPNAPDSARTARKQVSFRLPIAGSPNNSAEQPTGGDAKLLAVDTAVSPEEVAADAKRRARPELLSPVAMAPVPSIPSPPPSRPAGVVARKALLADSLGARTAARRRERQMERQGAIDHGALSGPLVSARQGATHVRNELDRIREEREDRVKKLFSQLDRLSKSFAKAISPSKKARASADSTAAVHGDDAAAQGGGNSTMALVPYSGESGIVHDYQTTVLLNLLRGKDSRVWLKAWLAEEGRVQKVREIVERAPPQLQAILAGILGRRLDELSADVSEEQEREVRITLLGGKSMIAPPEKTKGAHDEKPLPRPLPQAKPLLLLGYNPALDVANAHAAKKTSMHMHARLHSLPSPPLASNITELTELATNRAMRHEPILVSVPEDYSLAGSSPPRIEELEEWEAMSDGAFSLSHREV